MRKLGCEFEEDGGGNTMNEEIVRPEHIGTTYEQHLNDSGPQWVLGRLP